MKSRITLNSFRKLAQAEDAMMRAMMPGISAADTSLLVSPILPALPARRTWTAGRLVMPALTYTLSEVTR